MEVKIITKEEAVKLGLSSPNSSDLGKGSSKFSYIYVAKMGQQKAGGKGERDKTKDEIHQVIKIDNETNERETVFEDEGYKKLKKELGIKDE